MRWTLLPLLAFLPACFDAAPACLEAPCPPMPADTCTGQCAPYVGGGWSPVLVADAPDCPAEAPFAALSSDAPPLLACGAATLPGACSAPGYVCLPPSLPPWTVCVVRDGRHDCPEPYPDGTGAEGVTVCCPEPPEPPG